MVPLTATTVTGSWFDLFPSRTVSPFEKPTRQEALKYYRRVVDAFDLPIEFEEQVFAIEREQGPDRSEIFAVETRSAKGVRRIRHGRTVVLAIGYFDHPNVIGVPGEDVGARTNIVAAGEHDVLVLKRVVTGDDLRIAGFDAQWLRKHGPFQTIG